MLRINRVRRVLRASLCASLIASSAAIAGAQTWVPIGAGSAPGTEATVSFDAGASDGNHSVFDVQIFGFWRTPVIGGDGLKYDRIDVPGLPHYGQIGAPDLPAVRLRMAVMTQFPDIRLLTAQSQGPVVFPGVSVYPQPKPGNDEVPDPSRSDRPGQGA